MEPRIIVPLAAWTLVVLVSSGRILPRLVAPIAETRLSARAYGPLSAAYASVEIDAVRTEKGHASTLRKTDWDTVYVTIEVNGGRHSRAWSPASAVRAAETDDARLLQVKDRVIEPLFSEAGIDTGPSTVQREVTLIAAEMVDVVMHRSTGSWGEAFASAGSPQYHYSARYSTRDWLIAVAGAVAVWLLGAALLVWFGTRGGTLRIAGGCWPAQYVVFHAGLACLSREQRGSVLRASWRRLLRQPPIWCGVAVESLLLLGGVAVAMGEWGVAPSASIAIQAGAALWSVMFTVWVFRRMRHALHAELTERGIRPGRCVMCGYDLQGIDSLRCPECGASL